MKLIGSLTSPFVRKARIVLAEKKIEYTFELDDPWDEKSRVPDANPLGKVPVLVLEDDSTLFDSRVIVEFLDSVSPISRLIPADNREKIEYAFELDNPWDENSRVPDANPLGKVPVLVLEDDSTLFDSRVIVEFLDRLSPLGKLIPSDNREKIEVKRWEALADGVLDAAVAVVL